MATTHFENVDLLKSLMGGGRPRAPASPRAAPVAATPPLPTPPPSHAAGAAAWGEGSLSAPSSPALSRASLPGCEAAAPPPSPPGLPGSQACSGLKALFQAPVPLGFRAGKASPAASVASFHSLVAAPGGGPVSELEGDAGLLAARPAPYHGGGRRRISSPLPQTSGAPRHGGRSQLFVYKPRPPTALAAEATTESPADTLVFELDGSGVGSPPGPAGRRLVGESPEGEEGGRDPTGSEGEERPEQGARPAADASAESSPVAARRNEVESAAWHRRTKMFQV